MYDISIYIGNLSVKSKIMIRTKWTYPLPLSTVFLFALFALFALFCLISLKTAKSAKTLKFSDFQFVLWKIKSNCMSRLFCVANLLEVGRKKTFFLILWILTPFKPKWSKIFHIKTKDKSILINNVSNLTKTSKK